MSIKIQHKIIGYEVVQAEDPSHDAAKGSPKPRMQPQAQARAPSAVEVAESAAPAAPVTPVASGKVARMHEKVERPEMLVGSTYKIKSPVADHAFYITLNDMVLNPGTPYEKRRPFEMFINSKNMGHYQWISALTLIVSAVFRKGGDVTFLVEELKSVFDPKGGYYRRGGKYMPSLVAEIGDAIESHLKMIGLLVDSPLDPHQQAMVNQKRAQYDQQQAIKADPSAQQENAFPAGAELCDKCHHKAMIVLDNCLTCLNCGESKCG